MSVHLREEEWSVGGEVAFMTKIEIEMLCHLGHDYKTHNEKYRMTNVAAELAKVAKFLMAVDQGQVASHYFLNF